MSENNKQKEEALKTLGALGFFGAAAPVASILPFQNLLEDTTKIKQKEAQRMFPGAAPDLFDSSRGGVFANRTLVPLDQSIASSRVFDKTIKTQNPYESEKFFQTYLNQQPGKPSPELGSYQQVIANQELFPEGSIQALTVTPGPNPSRFAKDYAEVLADKLGKAINELNSDTSFSLGQEFPDDVKLQSKIETLSKKIPGTAGYVWGNIKEPQYSYAEGNWGLGQRLAKENPSVYISKINADPFKEAKYLYTSDILKNNKVDPRVEFLQQQDMGPGTGPSWGVADSKDISFRKDLINVRGELTTGDLQALLAERNLPFEYQSVRNTSYKNKSVPTKKPGYVLRRNLEKLAEAENITPYQAIEKFSRLVPNVGEPSTPPTPAVIGRESEFFTEGPALNPAGTFASKTDLRQLGILPPAEKAKYSPFTVDELDAQFNYVYPRHGASTLTKVDSYSAPVDYSDPFATFLDDQYKLEINRDKLRPQAANKLLDKTTKNLIEQSKPIQGLGLGGLATGAIATAMDPAVIDALSRGDYQQAGTTAALNTAIGSTIGGATAKGLQTLRAAGYARPAAAVGAVLPAAGGVLAGLGAVETGKALNRAYKAQTGKDWVTRNQPASPYSTYSGPTPTIKPRMGTAVLNNKPIQVPYGSVAGERKVGRPWWDKAGTQFQNLLNSFSPLIGR